MAPVDGKLTVVVAAHKPYWMPGDDAYLPVWVNAARNGASVPDGWARDDAGGAGAADGAGDHISEKNAGFCELTALYWAWKHLDADWLGLAHYRRHFATSRSRDVHGRVATGADLANTLAKAPIILPKRRHYYVETNYSQYVHAHHEQDLTTTRAILAESHPDYLAAYDASLRRRSGHRFNMFVMRRDYADEYCAWLFDVLFELERRLDMSTYGDYDRRVFGFVGERLMDPWIQTRMLPYVELPVVRIRATWARATRAARRARTFAPSLRAWACVRSTCL